MVLMDLTTFMQNLANAISVGSLYALIAIGYTMVYGILKLINFAHGDIFMMAAYFAFFGVATFGLPWYFAFIIAIAITALLGVGIEFTAYRPLRGAPKISVLISAIGVSFLLENLAVVLFGGRPKAFPDVKLFTDVVVIGGVSIQNLTFIIPIVTIALLFVLLHLVNNTNVGMAMRAASKDVETARLMGINVNRIISFTFAVG